MPFLGHARLPRYIYPLKEKTFEESLLASEYTLVIRRSCTILLGAFL